MSLNLHCDIREEGAGLGTLPLAFFSHFHWIRKKHKGSGKSKPLKAWIVLFKCSWMQSGWKGMCCRNYVLKAPKWHGYLWSETESLVHPFVPRTSSDTCALTLLTSSLFSKIVSFFPEHLGKINIDTDFFLLRHHLDMFSMTGLHMEKFPIYFFHFSLRIRGFHYHAVKYIIKHGNY